MSSEATLIDRSLHTILVVEDQVLIRMDISDTLRRVGFNVAEAANAEEAIRILQSGMSVSAVFTDVQMPGSLDGVGLALHIRESYPAMPCIITSGHLSIADLPHPAPGPLISKPYLHDKVVEAIERCLQPDPEERSRQVKS